MAMMFAGLAGRTSSLAFRLADEGWKYFLVSAFALAVDYSLLVALTEFAKVYYLLSAAVGFCAGAVVNYLLSVGFVFRTRRLRGQSSEFLYFFVIGIAGLALNEVAMKLAVEVAGLNYILAKVPAAGLSFAFNFGTRRAVLFTEKKAGKQA